jgi:hypothetical protein
MTSHLRTYSSKYTFYVIYKIFIDKLLLKVLLKVMFGLYTGGGSIRPDESGPSAFPQNQTISILLVISEMKREDE